jgi:hypothetical protein
MWALTPDTAKFTGATCGSLRLSNSTRHTRGAEPMSAA